MGEKLGQLLISIAGLTLVGGVVVITLPHVVPFDPIQFLNGVGGGFNSVTTALLLGIGILVVGATIRKFTTSPNVDRSPIIQEPVEDIQSNGYATTIHPLEQSYDGMLQALNSPTRDDRRLSMYGRKAIPQLDTNHRLQGVIDELTTTATEVHSVKKGISVEEAKEQIDNGTWTTNQKAAAFLSKTEEGVEFSILQRLVGYVSPKYTLQNRIRSSLEAIDENASTFLSYE